MLLRLTIVVVGWSGGRVLDFGGVAGPATTYVMNMNLDLERERFFRSNKRPQLCPCMIMNLRRLVSRHNIRPFCLLPFEFKYYSLVVEWEEMGKNTRRR